jgi:very-short-patch-repair endonuclease
VRSHTITVKRARRMRQALSPPELALWSQIKGRKLEGFAFRRQHPVGVYILDFYCEAARLAVEVDGQSHGVGDAPAYDARRDAWLREQGIDTLRLPASSVMDNLGGVLGMILDEVRQRAPSVPSGHLPR